MNTVTAKKPGPVLRDGDTQPWYRQFWPWFLIVLPGTVVVAALGTVYIAMRHADDLVMDDYYKSGLAINQRLGRQRIASEMGMEAQLMLLERRVQLRLQAPQLVDAGNYAKTLANIRLRFSHPLEADRDFSLTLSAAAPGLYVAELPVSVSPNWHWALDAGSDSLWQINGSLTAGDFLDQQYQSLPETALPTTP